MSAPTSTANRFRDPERHRSRGCQRLPAQVSLLSADGQFTEAPACRLQLAPIGKLRSGCAARCHACVISSDNNSAYEVRHAACLQVCRDALPAHACMP